MNFEAIIDEMTPEQRLTALHILWEKLAETPEVVEPPVWHGEVLAERTTKFERGESNLVAWEEARKRLKERFD